VPQTTTPAAGLSVEISLRFWIVLERDSPLNRVRDALTVAHTRYSPLTNHSTLLSVAGEWSPTALLPLVGGGSGNRASKLSC
jgi:hypothetical protein